MASPFFYDDPVGADDLVGRRPELDLLAERLQDLRNSRVEGPRRFGKTSLLRAALERAEAEGQITVYVNFLGVLSVEDVAARIDRAYGQQLDGAIRRWFDGVLRTLQPTGSAAPAGVGVSIAPQARSATLLERLALPVRLAERSGRRCAIAFDEFQEVVRVGAQIPATIRSEIEQHGDVAGYVFSGSHPGLMRDLFADRRHAFFAQAAPVSVGPLPADALAEFLVDRFRAHGDRDPGEGLGPLLDLAAGHPQRAMLLAHHLFEQTPTRTAGTIEGWERTRLAVFSEVDSEVTAAWAARSDLERRVLAAVADGSVGLNSQEAQHRFGLTKSSSNARAADRLWALGELVTDTTRPTGMRVTDPLLELWLGDGRRWPL